MADLDLRTDYKDDILDSSVNEKRKYNIIDNADGTKSLEDVSEYAQRGDSFGAVDINKTNQAVLDLNQSLTLDFSGASSDVQDVNTLLQNLLNRFYPLEFLLYDSGNQYTEITGGWQNCPYSYDSDYTRIDATFNTNNMVIGTTEEAYKSAQVTTVNPIDVTNYNYLRVEYVQNITGKESSPRIALVSDLNGYMKEREVVVKTNNANTVYTDLNISAISGSYYPVLQCSYARMVTVTKVFLHN